MIKNLCNLRNEKIQFSFILNYNGAGEQVQGKEGGEKSLNNWN